jgi:hypothetical protein
MSQIEFVKGNLSIHLVNLFKFFQSFIKDIILKIILKYLCYLFQQFVSISQKYLGKLNLINFS